MTDYTQETNKHNLLQSIFETMRQDSEAGLQMFYDEYGSWIYAVARKMCRSHYKAESVVNDVLVRFRKVAYQELYIEKPAAWIYRVTINAALDELKRFRKRREVPLTFEPISNENDIEKFIENDTFYWYIRHLSKREKEYIVRRLLYKETFQEIAEDLGVPTSSVSSKFYRGIKKLRLENAKTCGKLRKKQKEQPSYK